MAWALGAPIRGALVALIRLYRATLSSWLGGQCRFYPSCSRYAEQAIRVHGALRGTALAAWRVARCGPFTQGGVDHVPPGRHGAPAVDGGVR